MYGTAITGGAVGAGAGALAFTGASLGWFIVGGLALVVTGLLLARLGARKRHASSFD